MPVTIRDDILQSVQKPARYTGGELNSIIKDPLTVDIRFAFCFPDVYEVGMSHLGMRILYGLLNKRDDTYCERIFAPWTDMEAVMRENSIPLFSLETREPVGNFDLVGFTLQYEMSYTNILNMLNLSGIPLLRTDRKEGHPFVCAGGPCACNAEPLADFIDFFVLGEGEEVINEVLDAYKQWKNEGVSRKAFLNKIVGIEGVYVPGFYDVSYNADGTVKAVEPSEPGCPAKVGKRIIKDIDRAYFPEKLIVPYLSIVHDRIMLELFRGCTRGCRFCQAGFIYRPVRERAPAGLTGLARKLQNSTGYEEISLASLSTSDYSKLPELTSALIEEMEPRNVNLALPSLRIDSFSLDLMEKVQKVRKSSLTFAPEAGTQRLRDVINKGVTEEDLLNSVSLTFRGGWNGVKLYFMIGLPFETTEDVAGIADLARKVAYEYFKVPREQRNRRLEITVSTSSFVPKSFTPFQWEAQDSIDTLRTKQRLLKDNIRDRHLRYNWHDPELSFLEAVFARGDRRTGRVLLRAWELGSRFDSWSEHFRYDVWMKAFEDCGIDPAFYANRKRNDDEVFPWDHIDMGVSKKFLLRERYKAVKGETTPNCMVSCAACGAASFGQDICIKHTGRIEADNKTDPGTCPGAYLKTDSGTCSETDPGAGREKSGDFGQDGQDIAANNTGGMAANSVRVRFMRGDGARFVSHLDMIKVFERAIRRSGLPIAYSKGFNPRPQIVFGLPLAVGMTSDGEYADFELAAFVAPGQFMEKLNEFLPDAVRVTAAAGKNTKANIMASIKGADYLLEIYTNEEISLKTVEQKLKELLTRDSIKVLKESRVKDGRIIMKETEIRPLILNVGVEPPESIPSGYEAFAGAFVIKVGLKAGSAANLRPELFIKVLGEQAGITVATNRIHRKALYVEMDGRMTDPLDEAVLS